MVIPPHTTGLKRNDCTPKRMLLFAAYPLVAVTKPEVLMENIASLLMRTHQRHAALVGGWRPTKGQHINDFNESGLTAIPPPSGQVDIW
jgi:hypothetical protein